MKRTAPAAGGRRAPLTVTATAVVLLQLVAACAAGPSPSATAATSPTATAGAASQAPRAAAAAPSGSPVAGAPANPAASPAAAASSPVAQAGPLVVNPALQQAEGGLELVVAAYNVLQDRFFRPLDSRQLLGAAWEGARRELTQQRKLPNNVDPAQLSGDREADLASFADRYRVLMAAAGDGVDRARVAMVATSAMAESVGEQHTAFLTPDQFTRFKARITSEPGSVGLGILIDGQRAPFTIANVIPGGPSEQAGVQEGDQIERVNGRDVGRLELRELSELLRGEAGQPATLTLRRGGDTLDLTVTRARFTVPPLQSRVLPEGVCYLRLQTFPAAFVVGPSGRTLPQELDTQLERCEQAGARGWIMDLRGNGGGSGLSQVLGRFLDQGPILVERDKIGGRYEQATDGHPFRVQRPLVVLIDGGSASASEAFASAVQEYGRGVVMGQRSAGALNTANIVPLPLDAGLSVAIREVFTGRREVVVDEVGVTPDVELAAERDGPAVPRRAIEAALQPPPGVGPLPPTPPAPEGALLSEAELRRLIEPVQLQAADGEVPDEQYIAGDLAVDTLSYYAGDSPNLQAARERAIRLGWRGSLVRWLGRGFPPLYAADIQIYRDADGAHQDFREIYQPDEPRNPPQYRDIEPPVALGDDIRAMVGTGQNEGRIWLAWRRNNVVYVVAKNVTPGQPLNFDGVVRLARIVDARAAQAGPQGR